MYQAIADRAGRVVRSGHSAIVDAVHARAADRQAIERVARRASVPFIGLWLDAPKALLIERTNQRRSEPTEADEAVIRRQVALGPGAIDWHRLDASSTAEVVLRNAIALVDNRNRDQLPTPELS